MHIKYLLLPARGMICLPGLWMITLLFFLFLIPPAFAHGPVHEKIEKVSAQLALYPDSAALYMERGGYYREDGDFDKALADYRMVGRLNTEAPFLDLFFAELFVDMALPDSGLRYVNRFLDCHPDQVRAYLCRAQLHMQMDCEESAIPDFERALSLTDEPKPAYFLDISRAVLVADSTALDEAIGWLHQGQERLGYNLVLKGYEIELLASHRQTDPAISLIDEICNRFPRHEKWLLQKGRILEGAGRFSEALASYKQTLSAIESLPTRNRNTRMVMEWEAAAFLGIQRLSSRNID